MSLYLRSSCSSSSGNCLLLWTDHTRVVVDCGLGSMKRTKQLLKENVGSLLDIDAVVISHMHTDHIGHYPLRVIQDYGIEIRVHENCLVQLREKHFNGYKFNSLKLKPFTDRHFRVGDLTFRSFEVPHNPLYPTYGFVIKHENKKVVIATDFNSWDNLLGHFIDSDFIFVESNHDLGLLRRYFNPNSQFHMPNPETSKLLCSARKNSRKAPQAVMLGHLSLIRNEPDMALREVESSFENEGIELDFWLLAAPRLTASEIVRIKR